MENFVYDIPTKVYFGKGQIKALEKALPAYGKHVLIVYGGGSIKRNGIYDAAIALIEKAGCTYVDLSGVEANPRLETVKRGVALCREHAIDVVLAIGGGSVIDCAKVVAAGACYDNDPWDLVCDSSKIKAALPIVTVLTIAATGSEMDDIAVISNWETQEKRATSNPAMRPKASIMDPAYTFSVSAYQTASGVADIMSHTMESYFSNSEAYLQDRFAEGILKTCITYGPIALQHPDDYEARANIMWASSWAINNTLKWGHPVGWSVHAIEHQLSAVYDITHGIGLAILTPHWMEYVLNDQTVDKFAQLAHNVWEIEWQDDTYAMAKEGIECLRKFYLTMNIPQHLSDLGIDETHFEAMAQKASEQLHNIYWPLSKEDIIHIYQASL